MKTMTGNEVTDNDGCSLHLGELCEDILCAKLMQYGRPLLSVRAFFSDYHKEDSWISSFHGLSARLDRRASPAAAVGAKENRIQRARQLKEAEPAEQWASPLGFLSSI